VGQSATFGAALSYIGHGSPHRDLLADEAVPSSLVCESQVLPVWTRELDEIDPRAGRAFSAIEDCVVDAGMRDLLLQTFQSLSATASKNHDRWMVAYSGGKDSTLVTILTTIFLEANPDLRIRLRVVYSDTLLEMPPLRKNAEAILDHLRKMRRVRRGTWDVDVVLPRIEDRFWVKILGRGYPPPGPRFRWCTHRLKIRPANALLDREPLLDTAILTGVRYSESAGRRQRLVAACATGGECGQDYWYSRGPPGSNRHYYAPIVEWETCKVWDFLAFVAPSLGWPTSGLFRLYGSQDLRFGCWTCTLVKKDRTMMELMNRPGLENLKELGEFRNRLDLLGRDKTRRIMRPDGRPGPIDMATRRQLLRELLDLQGRAGKGLISRAEIDAIRREWRRVSWRNGNERQPSPRARLPRKRFNRAAPSRKTTARRPV